MTPLTATKLPAGFYQPVKDRFAPLRRLAKMAIAATTLFLCTASATAQCQWIPGPGFDLSTSTVAASTTNAMLVLPNGDLIAAGLFDSIGGVPANNIARWNGSVWAHLAPVPTVPSWPWRWHRMATSSLVVTSPQRVVSGPTT